MWSARQQWRTTSRASVSSLFDRQILPTFGPRPLNRMRRAEIEAWAAKLPVSRRYARQAANYLSTLLDAAVADGLIAANPARGTKRPKVDEEPIVPFTDAEVARLRAAAAAWFEVALTLGLGAGLRQSEATGLTVDRLDLLRRQLVVDRQLVAHSSATEGDAIVFGPPKSARSYRTVPLADAVVEEIARHLEQHGPGEHGLVLHQVDGRPLRHEYFGIEWRRLRTTAGMPTARFHDTRHTYASVLLSGGVSVAAAAEYLGHSPGMLLSTYAHLLPADHDRARSVVQAAFDRDAACPAGVPTVSS